MNITREQIGRAIGYAVLFFGWVGIAYVSLAFLTWQGDPGAWGTPYRVVFLVIFLICVLVHLVRTKINVVADDEQR
jgi:Kef-type K+ transport system membrane component KefB